MKHAPWIAAGAFALAGACSPQPPKPPNVVWVVWDTVRADHMSLYGYSKKTTPFLDEWARGARVYDDCLAASSWTVPSHASMFTGTLPAEHGANNDHQQLDEELTTIAELLKGAGYQTFAWTANPHLSDDENFLQGFDVRQHPWDDDELERAQAVLDRKLGNHAPKEFAQRQERNAASHWLVKAAGELGREQWLAWMRTRDPQRPFFAFFNYMEAHRPLIPERSFRERTMSPEELGQSYRLDIDWTQTWSYCFGLTEIDPAQLRVLAATYDAAVLELDTLLRDLVHSLDEQGLGEDTVVIVTSDHGDHLGEHHMLDHQYSVSQVLLRVPLVIRFTKRFPAGRDARPVTNMDLFPTLLELAHVDAPRAGAGFARSLLDAQDHRARIADYLVPFKKPLDSVHTKFPEHDTTAFERGQVALIDGRWKLVWATDGSAQLYDLAQDPGELRDVAGEHSQEIQRLRQNLGKLMRALRPLSGTPDELKTRSAEQKARLRALGYLGDDEPEPAHVPASSAEH